MPAGAGTDRRRFIEAMVMTMAAGHFGVLDTAKANDGTRELTSLAGASQWINSPRLTASALAGRVVLADFCTYTCINWLRTLPYLRAWARKYRDEGLLVVGVHTPEFLFERDIENVRRAIAVRGIEYPIAIDNDYAIWRTFDNQYWPALYLLDAHGRIRHRQFGEGGYDASETAIQRLLSEAGAGSVDRDRASVDAAGVEAAADWDELRSAENYLGYARTQNFAGGGVQADRAHVYTMPSRLSLNHWALSGEWTVGNQSVALHSPHGRLGYRFRARDLHVVMGPSRAGKRVRFRASLDGARPGSAHGLDINDDGTGTVVEPRLYQLMRQPRPIVDRQFEIEFLDAGVQLYSFTFG